MKHILILALFLSACGLRKPYGAPCPPAPARSAVHAAWDEKTKTWTCPSSMDTWVDEAAFMKWKIDQEIDFVYCVPKTPSEIQGIEPDPYLPQPYRSELLRRS